jgi:hypothetical protein
VSTSSISIADALADSRAFKKDFEAVSWNPWKTFLRALFALPPKPGDLKLFQQCTGRTTWPRKPFSEATCVCGRRGGKLTDPLIFFRSTHKEI